jgi:hypothetical protein
MTKPETRIKSETRSQNSRFVIRHSDLIRHSDFEFRVLPCVPVARPADTSINHLRSDKQLPEESDRVSDGRFPHFKKNLPNPIRAGNAENSYVPFSPSGASVPAAWSRPWASVRFSPCSGPAW